MTGQKKSFWPFLVALALALHSPLSLAMLHPAPAPSAAAPNAKAAAGDNTGMPASLPLKRDSDAGAGIGAGPAALTAGALLIVGVWAAARSRRRLAGAGAKAIPASLPWLGRFMQAREGRALRVIESAPLTAQVRVHVVEWHGTEYLVSTSPGAISVLDKRVAPPAVTAGTDAPPITKRRK